jgi:outer membrane murein-binding lipoprotein Lpp
MWKRLPAPTSRPDPQWRNRSCAQPNNQSHAVAQLTAEVRELSAAVDRLSGEIDYTSKQAWALEFSRTNYQTAELDPAARVYLRLDSSVNVGSFAVSLGGHERKGE